MSESRRQRTVTHLGAMPRDRHIGRNWRCERNWSSWSSRLRSRYSAARRQAARLLQFLRQLPRTNLSSRTATNHYHFHGLESRLSFKPQINLAMLHGYRLDRNTLPISRPIVERSADAGFGRGLKRLAFRFDKEERPEIVASNRRSGLFGRSGLLDGQQYRIRRPISGSGNTAHVARLLARKHTASQSDKSDKRDKETGERKIGRVRPIVSERFSRAEKPRQQLPRRLALHTGSEQPARREIEFAPNPAPPHFHTPEIGDRPQSMVNVDSLADRVMDKINRRMTAWRERTGRV